jgi:hypothetical protein
MLVDMPYHRENSLGENISSENENLLRPPLTYPVKNRKLAIVALCTAFVIFSLLAAAGNFVFINTSQETKQPPHKLSGSLIPAMPKECTPYIQNQGNQILLNLHYGRYIYSPQSNPPYNSPCFIMKSRYNCISPNATDPEEIPHNWRFVLQSNTSDDSTQCDFISIIDAMGGPAALPRDRSIALMGNSYLRQLFESLACKYKSQLSELLLHKDGPEQTISSFEQRRDRPYKLEEYGSAFSFDTTDEDNVCFTSSEKEDLQRFYSVVLPERLKLVPNCTDNFAIATYKSYMNTIAGISQAENSTATTLSVFYNFRPHHLTNPNGIYEAFLGHDVMQTIDTIFWNDGMQKELKNKVHVPQSVQWINLSMLMPTLETMQKRDAGLFFLENNPLTLSATHPCMPGLPEDETAILLFMMMFDLDVIIHEGV